MPMYDTYLIKKVAVLKVVEADDICHAEEIAYKLLENESFDDPSDPDWDRYVYVAGEIENA